MSINSSLNLISNLTFGAGFNNVENFNNEEVDESESNTPDALNPDNEQGPPWKRESMYVTLFETMVDTVLTHEDHLIAEQEWPYFARYSQLSYEARYLLIRLCLRKQDKWHRIDQLKYQQEIGDPASVTKAIKELCDDGHTNEEPEEVKREETEIIDLTLDDDEEDEQMSCIMSAPVVMPTTGQEPQDTGLSQTPSFDIVDTGQLALAEDETRMTIHELLECLNADELKKFAKQMKQKLTGTRVSLVTALLDASFTQNTLNFPVISSSSKSKKLKQIRLPFASTKQTKTQQERLREIIVKALGKCIRVNKELFEIFRRVNLIYFRNTQHTPTLLTPSILSRSNKRGYPKYRYTRRADIWPNRDALIAYEEALALEARVEGILDTNTGSSRGRSRSVASKTPAPTSASTSRQFKTPASVLKGKGKDKENLSTDEDAGMDVEEDATIETPKVQDARLLKEIFEEVIFPRWKALVATKDEEEARPCALERFHCGHIFTRLVCKGANALATLKEYEYELDVLDALLAQKRWRRGRRGRWYDRRALILTTHFPKDDVDIAKRAMQGVVDALLDDDTHIIHRPMLQRRLTRLEKKLKVPPGERHTNAGQLRKAEETTIEGTRIYKRASSLCLDNAGRAINKTPLQSASGSLLRWTPKSLKPTKISSAPLKGNDEGRGKSVWKGRGGQEINVETLALQHYENMGYKGFHCEGRILCTIFGLLFWDVLFADVPGAFETPYQSAPLDIAEDCFYHAREGLIKDRLTEIEQGKARKILEKTDDEQRPSGTWCVGVRWDMFEKQDLLEIVDCLGGTSLSVICRLFCEDYARRGAGVPDLTVWNTQKGKCKFVEVKGPGDSLQENQKIWIDLLLRAGAEVEMCFVVEKGKQAKKKAPAKQRASTSKKGKRKGEKTTDSDAEDEVIVASEDEWGASPNHWKTNTGKKIEADEHELTTVTIKTCLHLASIENPTQEPMDTDNEEDQLDVSPSEARKSYGTKRKANHVPPSPTPKSMSRSSSQKMIPEVLIMVPSPPKKIRLTHS